MASLTADHIKFSVCNQTSEAGILTFFMRFLIQAGIKSPLMNYSYIKEGEEDWARKSC